MPPPHHAANGSFRNPWPSALPPTTSELISLPFPLSLNSARPNPPRIPKRLKPDWGAAETPQTDYWIKTTLLGHATVLLEFPLTHSKGKSIRVLFDPVFSTRVGPGGVGPARLVEVACGVKDFEGVEVVCISHNHYDHLDLPSIMAIHQQFPEVIYFVPLGNKSWFEECGIPKTMIHELDWWDSKQLDAAAFDSSIVTADSSVSGSSIKFSCVPAQHSSGRGVGDQGSSLWCGWVVEHLVKSSKSNSKSDSPNHHDTEDSSEPKTTRTTGKETRIAGKALFVGDSGYRRFAKSTETCPAFREIGERFGGFDVALIPIWRGGTLGFLSTLSLRLSHETLPTAHHASPQDAVDIHTDVKSKLSLAIHFGSFVGSESETVDAVTELRESCTVHGVVDLDEVDAGAGRMGILDFGKTLLIEVNNEL